MKFGRVVRSIVLKLTLTGPYLGPQKIQKKHDIDKLCFPAWAVSLLEFNEIFVVNTRFPSV